MSAIDFDTTMTRIFDEFPKVFKVSQAIDAPMSASIGVANYPRDGDTVDGLIRNADRAMYQSKLQGKGQVTHYVPSDCAFT